MNVLLTPRPFHFYFPPPSPQFYYFSSSILFFLHHHHHRHRHHISIVFSSTTTTSFYCFPSTTTAPTITIFLLWWWWWWRENNRSAFVNSSRVLRVRFVVVTFNPALYKVSSVLKKHLNILQSSPNCKETFPLELTHSNRDAVRKAWEAHLIHKENTLFPLGIN